MQKLILFTLAFFLFLSPISVYGGPPPIEEYQAINYGGGSSGGSGYGAGYTAHHEVYVEHYVEEHHEEYVEHYVEEHHEEYVEHHEEYVEHHEEYVEHHEEYIEHHEEQHHYYEGYGYTPSYVTEEMVHAYGYSAYGYAGTPYYNNAANHTYTSHYEEAYMSGETEAGGAPAIPFVPTSLLTGFVVDIHFLAGDPSVQYIAYHYCADLYPGYTQCDVYNGTAANSKLVATEVIVTADIFAQLPMEERKLWHSHAFAVTSGILVAPNAPPDQELTIMASVMNSYGKVTDFFHSQLNFPYGGAKLAYGLAAPSQIIPAVADQLDQSLGLKTTWQQRAVQRQSLNPTILPGADDYLTSGQFPQYVTQSFPVAGGETGESVVNEAEESSMVGETGESSMVGETGESSMVGETGEIPMGNETGEIPMGNETGESPVENEMGEAPMVGETGESSSQ